MREHFRLPLGMRYLRNALASGQVYDRRTRIHAWEAVYRDAKTHFGEDSDKALADAVSQSIERRLRPGKRKKFTDFMILVGQQGSGKDTLAQEVARRGYFQVTMSDIVKALAPALGFSPDTTQGKIDAGHAMRRLFGRSILMNLSVQDARDRRKKKLVVAGPRSMHEVKAGRVSGARIIGLIAHKDPKQDRKIRLHRVTVERLRKEPNRVMTKKDFSSREKQERLRAKRMLGTADVIVVTNRKAADLVDKLVANI